MPQTINGETYLDGDEVATLLGVKKATLYAYVSRGVLQSHRQAVGRRRLYRQADVETLCAIQADTIETAQPAPAQDHDGVLRNVTLPYAESWAADH